MPKFSEVCCEGGPTGKDDNGLEDDVQRGKAELDGHEVGHVQIGGAEVHQDTRNKNSWCIRPLLYLGSTESVYRTERADCMLSGGRGRGRASVKTMVRRAGRGRVRRREASSRGLVRSRAVWHTNPSSPRRHT